MTEESFHSAISPQKSFPHSYRRRFFDFPLTALSLSLYEEKKSSAGLSFSSQFLVISHFPRKTARSSANRITEIYRGKVVIFFLTALPLSAKASELSFNVQLQFVCSCVRML